MEKNKGNLTRKVVHLFSGILIILIYLIFSSLFSINFALFVLVFILILFLGVEYFRIEKGRKIPIPLVGEIWKKAIKDKEKDAIGGNVFFFLGAILVLAVFDIEIAILAILMMAFGDLAAAILGPKVGKRYITKKKSFEGILAEFFIDLTVGFISLFFLELSWLIILVMALVATITETMVDRIDDNLVVPIFAGFSGQVIKFLTLWSRSFLPELVR